MECFTVFLAVVVFLLFAFFLRTRSRLRSAEERIAQHQSELVRFDALIQRLRTDVAALRETTPVAPAAPHAEPARAPSPSSVAAIEAATPPAPPASINPIAPQPPVAGPVPTPAPPLLTATASPAPAPALAREVRQPDAPPRLTPSGPVAPVTPPPAAPPTPMAPSAPVAPAPPVPPRRPSPPAPPVIPPRAPKGPRPPFDWERLIGVKLFSWGAGVLFALAAIYFLRISIERGWLSPSIRMAIGLLFGTGLLVICELKAARRYAVTANALDAAGILTLFATVFAAHALWQLIGTVATFGLMVLITAVAVLLSIRRDSLFIALLGLIGGFSTPILLSTGEDRPIGLFGYLLLLNAGLAWVAQRRRWKILPVLSLLFTTLYQWGWTLRFLDPARLPLAFGIFLVFPLLAFVAPLLARRKGTVDDGADEEDESHFRLVAAWSASLPLLFALYLSAVQGYGSHFHLLFGFLFVLSLGHAAIAAVRGPRFLHPLAAGSAVLSFLLWCGVSYRPEAWPAILGWLALFVLFYLAAPWLFARLCRPLDGWARFGTLAAPLLLAIFPILIGLEPRAAAPGLPFGVLFILLTAIAVAALLYEEGWLYFIATFFALAAEAIWSALHLSQDRLLSGIALYGFFGLFYLGVPLLARRFKRTLKPEGSGAILLLLSLGLLFFLAAGSMASVAFWGLALLLAVLNLGLFFEGREGRRPVLSLIGMVLSWIVVAVWWASVPLAEERGPALFLVGGFGVLVVFGALWMKRQGPATGRGGAASSGLLGEGVYLGLVGHLFLLFVATQGSLSVPPWPLLGVMGVLDLAIGIAALYSRRTSLHAAALAASHLVLLVWMSVVNAAPWLEVAVWSAAALSAFALLWIAAGRRIAGAGSPLARSLGDAALGGLFAGEVLLMVAGFFAGAPPLALLLPLHLAFLVALLVLASREGRFWAGVLAVPFTAVAVLGWMATRENGLAQAQMNGLWRQNLLFAGAIYLVFLAWPLVLGERAKRQRAPYLAAVLASAPFFLVGVDALRRAGFGGVVGVVPILQAIALAVLLANLLKREEPAQRLKADPGRLATVAGAILAFITLAVPLQLDREWITLAWALLAAALAWLYGKVPHRGLLIWTCGLLAAVFIRLAFNPAVLGYHVGDGPAILNWYLYGYGVPALAFLLAGWLLLRTDDVLPSPLPRISSFAYSGGVVLLFLLLNIEIADFFSTGPTLTFGFLTGNASLAEDLASTLGWAVFAIALLSVGIALRNRAARVAGICLLVAAALKGFLHDVARLGGFYRVGSFVGLAVSLALVAVLLQKFVFRTSDHELPEGPEGPEPEGEPISQPDPADGKDHE